MSLLVQPVAPKAAPKPVFSSETAGSLAYSETAGSLASIFMSAPSSSGSSSGSSCASSVCVA